MIWRVILVMVLVAPLQAEPLRMVVSTTLLEGIALEVGGHQVEVTPVIPYAMCPGHFDLSPQMARKIASADLFVQHGFEAFARGLRLAGEGPVRVKLEVQGNGMIPEVHRKLVQAMVAIMTEARPQAQAFFEAEAARYLEAVVAAEASVQPGRARLKGVPVVAAAMNAPFVAWAGCRVAAVFPRDDGVSAAAMHRLARQTGEQRVRLVVDNRQSAGRTGATLAREQDVPLVMLSNFPDLEDGGGYPVALKMSVSAMVAALRE